jgi:hypothetical protein
MVRSSKNAKQETPVSPGEKKAIRRIKSSKSAQHLAALFRGGKSVTTDYRPAITDDMQQRFRQLAQGITKEEEGARLSGEESGDVGCGFPSRNTSSKETEETLSDFQRIASNGGEDPGAESPRTSRPPWSPPRSGMSTWFSKHTLGKKK